MNATDKNMIDKILSNRIRTGYIKLAGMALAILLLVFSVLGCMTMEMSGSGSQSKGAMSAVSEAGLFRTSIESEVDPIPVNAIHAWKLH
jgi:hypothetical protein